MFSKFQIMLVVLTMIVATLLFSSCDDNDDAVVVKSQEEVEILTEAELYEYQVDSLQKDTIHTIHLSKEKYYGNNR